LPVKAKHIVFSIATAGSVVYAIDDGYLFRSDDQGRHWRAMSTLNKRKFIRLAAVAVDPRYAQRVYALDEQNILWRSADGGQSWVGTKIPGAPGTSDFGVPLVINHLDPSRILLSGAFSLYRSSDAGQTWSTNRNAFDSVHVPNDLVFLILSLAFDAGNPMAIYLSANIHDGFFRSEDGGESWQQVRSRGFPSYHAGDTLLAANPSRSGQLLAADSWNPENGDMGEVAATIDGGRTWTRLSAFPGSDARDALLIEPNNPLRVLFAVDDVTADDTIVEDFYVSGDGGLHWQRTRSSIRGTTADINDKLTVLVAGL
jgi:photosystem II stability/assembly factor-like uncharacterized protein